MICLDMGNLSHGTTLSQTGLYERTFDKVASIQNLRKHPCEFYEKLGYKTVGVLPNANGWDEPGIWMAKMIVPRPNSQ